MPLYIVHSNLQTEHGESADQTVFEAASDEEARRVGRRYREVLSLHFANGRDYCVRCRVVTLEVGCWDPESDMFTTTSSRQLLDTADDDQRLRAGLPLED